jgi:hypothetical protein
LPLKVETRAVVSSSGSIMGGSPHPEGNVHPEAARYKAIAV